MAGAVSIRMDGLKELDAALGELSKATARGVLRRTLVKAGEPMRAEAARLAPDDPDTGPPDLHTMIGISSRIDNRAGKAEYAQAMMDTFGDKNAARQALRDARRAAGIGQSFAEVFIGPVKGTKRQAIKAMAHEFGAVHHAAQPYMRPAFDAKASTVLAGVKDILAVEIAKAVTRAKARALKKAARAAA